MIEIYWPEAFEVDDTSWDSWVFALGADMLSDEQIVVDSACAKVHVCPKTFATS